MRALLLILLLAGALIAIAPTASAGVTEQDLPEGWTNPSNLAFDPDGALWLTLDGNWAIARWDLASNETRIFPLSMPKRDERDSMGALVFDGAGGLWTSSSTHLHHLATNGTIQSYAFPSPAFLPGGIHLAQDGAVWVALVDRNVLHKLDPASGTLATFPIPDARGGPLEFLEMPNGTVYLTTTYADTVATFDGTTGAVRLAPRFVKSPVGLAAQNDSLWIAEMGYSSVTVSYPTTGGHMRYPTSASPYYAVSGPSGILAHPDGSIWFAEHFADRIARLDLADRQLHEYEVPSSPGTNTQRIVLGPDGEVWFAEYSTNKIGRATFTNEPASFILPANVSIKAGESIEITVPSSRTLKTGTSDENLTVAPFAGKLRITAAASLAPGAYEILVASTERKTTVGQYMTVNVDPPTRDSPAPALLAIVLLAGIAALARRRR